MLRPLLLFCLGTCLASPVTLTPWCSNSFRVQVAAPASAPPGHAAAAARLRARLAAEQLEDLPGALIDECGPGAPIAPLPGTPYVNGNLRVTLQADGSLDFSNAATGARYFSAAFALAPSAAHAPYLAASLNTTAGDPSERVFGLGQGGWTGDSPAESIHCPTLPVTSQAVVPLQRNGQTVNLQQRKFHVSIPLAYSTAGYAILYNMPGYGSVAVGNYSVGGMAWASDAALALDFWVSGLPAGALPADASAIYRQYADATGHAPPLREDAMLYWQSRNRYKSSAIVQAVAANYSALQLPVGMLVVDYENQAVDGDFAPNPACYPSVAGLAASVRATLNATTAFSFWPEVRKASSQYAAFSAAGCLSNSDLGGSVLDTTITACRDLIWRTLLRPHYYDQGVTSYWLDETDGEGTAGGYDTSFGPAAAYSQLWVNSWLSTFATPVAALGEVPPLVLTRGVWAGGQRYGVVLWSSDIQSSFEQLASMVPQGVHTSMSGIPCYGCNFNMPNNSSYMQELIVRWHQFSLFCPVFRTHGCRQGPSEPDVAPCTNVGKSCGPNEVWSYGADTQALLSDMIRYRANVLKPYIAALARNVSAEGVPTMRPLWYEFPADPAAYDVDDQYLLGPDLLVAPVTAQGATNRSVVFPGAGVQWQSVWDAAVVVAGGATHVVQAPLSVIPVYRRV